MGNIILTNGEYEVIALLRSHKFNDLISIKVGEVYPIAFATSLSSKLIETGDGTGSGGVNNFIEFVDWCRKCVTDTVDKDSTKPKPNTNTSSNTSTSAKKKMGAIPIKQLLLYHTSPFSSYGPEIIEHCILECGVAPSTKVTKLLTDFDVEVDVTVKVEVEGENEHGSTNSNGSYGSTASGRSSVSQLEALYNIFTVDSNDNNSDTSGNTLNSGGGGVAMGMGMGPIPVQLQAQLDIPGQPGYIVYKPSKIPVPVPVLQPPMQTQLCPPQTNRTNRTNRPRV